MGQLEKSEAAAKAERRQAQQWLRRHAGAEGSLPPHRRLATGEGAARERSDYVTGLALFDVLSGRGRVVGTATNKGSRPVSYSSMWGEGGEEGGLVLLEEGFDIHALTGFPPRTAEQVALDARVAHVLSFLREDRAELLRERFMYDGGHTLADIAEGAGVSRQAIAKRLKYAVADFAAAYAAHLYDPIEFEEES